MNSLKEYLNRNHHHELYQQSPAFSFDIDASNSSSAAIISRSVSYQVHHRISGEYFPIELPPFHNLHYADKLEYQSMFNLFPLAIPATQRLPSAYIPNPTKHPSTLWNTSSNSAKPRWRRYCSNSMEKERAKPTSNACHHFAERKDSPNSSPTGTNISTFSTSCCISPSLPS